MNDAKRQRREAMMGPQGTRRNNSSMPGAPQGNIPLRPQAGMNQGPNNQDLNPNNFNEQPPGGLSVDGYTNQYTFGEQVQPDVPGRMGYVSGMVGNSGQRAEFSGRRGLNSAGDGMPGTPAEMYNQMEGNYFSDATARTSMRNSPDGIPPSEIGPMGFIGSPTNLGQMPEPPASMRSLPIQGMPSTDFSSPNGLDLAPGNNMIKKGQKKGKK